MRLSRISLILLLLSSIFIYVGAKSCLWNKDDDKNITSGNSGTTTTETVSIPNQPIGITSGTTGVSYNYSTGGAASNLGHMLIEYQFDWGDGTYSNWSSSTTTSNSWASANTYIVKAQARCITDTSVVSRWSSGLSVSISLSWSPITTTNVLSSGIVSVWTGTEMIVWDRWDGPTNVDDGGRYYPITDIWLTITTTNAPLSRTSSMAIWTGQEMIVWGGQDGGVCLNTGAKYNPISNTWTAITTTNAPVSRTYHTAVWTGQEMIIWGGDNGIQSFNTGAKYNPVIDTWNPITTTNAPISRDAHTAVWTGTEMIIWGGAGDHGWLNTGAKYYPITDTWIAITTVGAPTGRSDHTAVWTGQEMLVWGGEGTSGWLNDGAKYNPAIDTWTPISTINAPVLRSSGYATPGLPGWVSVWTATELIIWGGFVPESRYSQVLNTGAKYNPITDTWTPITTSGALSARGDPCAVWTGTEVIIWGGYDGTNYLQDGAKYKP
jgi:N-acetylneuraminic acid mutarotase